MAQDPASPGQARNQHTETQPFVLHEAGAGGMRVVAANGPARAAGIETGLTLSDASARVPRLASAAIDRAADQAALTQLARWMVRYTPLVALDGLDGLMLETTGCDHLFGGEEAMADAISTPLARAGYAFRIGLADTPVAAAALVRDGRPPGVGPAIVAEGQQREGLADLPMAALRLAPDTLTLLRRFGLTRIGQLYGIDRKALSRRFQSRQVAGQVMTVLDQALGLRPAPLIPLRPAPDYAARLPCPEPLIERDGIHAGLSDLTEQVCADLSAHGCGARRFTLHAFRADGTLAAVSVSAARPVRTPKHILGLFAETLDTLDPGYGIDLLLLEADRTAPMETGIRPLSTALASKAIDATDLAALADRLVARLGDTRVSVLAPEARHLPEAACRITPFQGRLPDWPRDRPTPSQTMGPRPLMLFDRPEPVDVIAEVPDGPPLRFVWRRVPRRVVRADGPERIAPEWWTYLGDPRAASRHDGSRSGLALGDPRAASRHDGSRSGLAFSSAPHAPEQPRQPLPPLGASAPAGASKTWLVPKMDPRADANHIEKARAALHAPRPETPSAGALLATSRPRARDYYRAEDAAGLRYWLFRDGLYGDGRGGMPVWYVHGVGP
ncbi:MAG: DNA polymerase Y family protein [Pseudomonadota bacterium]